MTIFRKRMGFMPDGPPIIDAVPVRVRIGIQHLLKDHLSVFGNGSWMILYQELLRGARRAPLEGGANWEQVVTALLLKCEWLEFYEIVEHVSEKLNEHAKAYSYYPSSARHFTEFRFHLNQLFADENVGFELDEAGKIQMNASREMVEASAAALEALKGDAYSAPSAQLHRALEKLTFRQMDPTNAVKDAVGSLQGVLGARFGGKGDLGDYALQLRSILHPTLAASVAAMLKVEAYRGDMAAHADKPGKIVTVEEAIFVVHICAAAVALIASRREPSRAQ